MNLHVDIHLRVGAFDLRTRFESCAGITALFGPSGAGKTLTLRCIAGLSRPESGLITCAGTTVFDAANGIDLPSRRRGIGYVFQQYALFPHLTVAKNVGFALAHLDRSARAERVDELLRLVGLEGMQKRRPDQLSGGQQQRVALARAIAAEPRLLLLDEPFAAVDLRVRRRLRAELRRIHEATGTPMLLVTHDLREVEELSGSLVLIDHGRMVAAGPTSSLLTAPLDPRVADLLNE